MTASIALALVFAVSVFAASKDVAILYNKNTSVNIEALKFLKETFSKQGKYNLKLFMKPQDIKPGLYTAVIVLNTGLAAGIDPLLADFIKSWQDKPRIILLTLKKGSSDLTVTQFAPSADTLGVDAVSAASAFKGKGIPFGGANPEWAMHIDWSNRLIKLVDARP
jgi:hypothetical protein